MQGREHRQWLTYEVVRLTKAGRSQREIASALKRSRKTISGILHEQEARRNLGGSAVEAAAAAPRLPKGSKLDRFDEKIRGWLEQYRNLTAVRCLEKLKEEDKDFSCGYTIVREYLKRLRGPTVPATAVEMKAVPGRRLEFDWSPYDLTDGLRVQLWNATLPWSRGICLLGETNTRQTTTMTDLRRSFETFEGVTEEVLTDSMPGVVDGWELDRPILNARFVDMAAHYRVDVVIARRATPTDKARVERRFWYHELNLLNGRTIRSLEAYRDLLAWWQREKAMQRPHPETGRPIAEMLAEERKYLKPLPVKPYDTRDVVVRVVSATSHVHLATNEYSVPDGHVGQRVYLCASAVRVSVADDRARILIEHERLPDGAGIRQPQIGAAHRQGKYDVEALSELVAEWGEEAKDFASALRRSRRYSGPELARLLNLQLTWRLDDIVGAIRHAAEYGCFETRALERILEAKFAPRRFEEVMAESTRRRIQEVMQAHPVDRRPLASYASLREGDRPMADGPQEKERDRERAQEGKPDRESERGGDARSDPGGALDAPSRPDDADAR
ncbi:MAG: IS21 family transposase [Planctomycetota bacterium]